MPPVHGEPGQRDRVEAQTLRQRDVGQRLAVSARGYAYASTDKGNMGARFYKDGSRPGGSIAEWHHRNPSDQAIGAIVRDHRPTAG